MSAEESGQPFEDPRLNKKPKNTAKGPQQQKVAEFNAMALDTKGFQAFL